VPASPWSRSLGRAGRRGRSRAGPGHPVRVGVLEPPLVGVGLGLGDRPGLEERADRGRARRHERVDELLLIDADVLGDRGEVLARVHPDVHLVVGDAEHLDERRLDVLVAAVKPERRLAVRLLDEADELVDRAHRGDVDAAAGAAAGGSGGGD
jgi:hypothetical protein